MFNFLKDVGNYEDRKVGRYDDGDISISTCAVSDGSKPFETAISHPDYNNNGWIIVESYDTREEAKNGHQKWIETVKASLPDNLSDVGNGLDGIAKMLNLKYTKKD